MGNGQLLCLVGLILFVGGLEMDLGIFLGAISSDLRTRRVVTETTYNDPEHGDSITMTVIPVVQFLHQYQSMTQKPFAPAAVVSEVSSLVNTYESHHIQSPVLVKVDSILLEVRYDLGVSTTSDSSFA